MPASIGVNMRVTGHYSQGGRKYMEDKFSVAYQQTEDEKDLEYAYFGIFDGHGGSEAAAFAKENLMDLIVRQRQFWSENDDDVLRAIRNGYMMTHMNMWKELDKWPKTVSGLPSTAGTTASVAFIRRGKIYIGHVGDSAIVLGYQVDGQEDWCAKPLTLDHKPESPLEMSRIHSSGGKVIAKAGVPRVVWNRPVIGPTGVRCDEIPFLAVARSLGDLWSYNMQIDEFVVSPDPDVGVLAIDPSKFRCLIFGTDGLWNMVSARMAVQLVQVAERHNEKTLPGGVPPDSWLNPSKILVDSALQRWSSTKMRADNTSVVTLMMDPPGPPKTKPQHPNNPISNPPPQQQQQQQQQSSSPTVGRDATENYSSPSPCSSVDELPASPIDERPDNPPEAHPSKGLSILTRFPNAKTEVPQMAPQVTSPVGQQFHSYPPGDDDSDLPISNYGNPAESYFIARLLNKNQIRNTLQNVYEEITTADILPPGSGDPPVNNNNEEDPPYKKNKTVLQRPRPTAEKTESANVNASPETDVPSETVPVVDDETAADEDDNSSDNTIESIQINEVSSSSPVEVPASKTKGVRSKAPIKRSSVSPTPPVARILRSNDSITPVAPPRPITRLANRGKTPVHSPSQNLNGKGKQTESKVPVPVHSDRPAPPAIRVTVLNRPKVSPSPSLTVPLLDNTSTLKAERTPSTAAVLPVTDAKIKQLEKSDAKPRLVSGSANQEGNGARVTRSRDLQVPVVKAPTKTREVVSPSKKIPTVVEVVLPRQVVTQRENKPEVVARTLTVPRLGGDAPTGGGSPRRGGMSFLRRRRRESAADNTTENSKENVMTPVGSAAAVTPKTAKRRCSGGAAEGLEPKEKRRTRLDDRRRFIDLNEESSDEQHQDVTSTQTSKDAAYLLGAMIPPVDFESEPSIRRSLRNEPEELPASPKNRRRRNKKDAAPGLNPDETGEVHSTTVNIENDPKANPAPASRSLRSRHDVPGQEDKHMSENSVDKRALRSADCSIAERENDESPSKECRPVLRSRNSVGTPASKISARRRTPWTPAPVRHGLRKRLTK